MKRPDAIRPDAYLDFPLHVAGDGQVARTEVDDHVRDMLHQLLFTGPGERVNRPDFGCGLLQSVFDPNSELLAATTELIVRNSIRRWLPDVVEVESLQVTAQESTFVVDLRYRRLLDGTRFEEHFESPSGIA